MGSGEVTASAAGVRAGPLTRRQLLNETWLVLGVSLGASAIWSVLSLIRQADPAEAALNRQTTAMNSSVTPDRPWLDLAYQLTGIVLALVPVALALHLLRRDRPDARHDIGADLRRPGQDLLRGALLAAAVGIPGLALYAARAGARPQHHHRRGEPRATSGGRIPCSSSRPRRTRCSRRSSWSATSSPAGGRSAGRCRWSSACPRR